MKRVIYYFSGTGNSMRAAMRIAEEIGGAEIISVRMEPEEVSCVDAEVIGFVCPAYEWDIPGTMREFVRKLSINPTAYIFMVCTYVAIHGKSFETMEALLREKQAHLSYGRTLQCVASQCTAYSPFPPERVMVPITERRLNRIAKEIKEQKIRKIPSMSLITRRLYPKVMTPYMKVEHEFDKGFYTSNACIGCQICKQVCPTKNIIFEQGHPVWNHQCHGCMACVAYCPRKAIQFKTPEAYVRLNTMISRKLCLPEKRKRYHNPYIRHTDLGKERQYIQGKEE